MVNKLKTALEQKAGLKLDSLKACRKMEKMLYERGFFVSYTTLSRIFSVARISAQPRGETLNLLSKFLGFDSFDAYLEYELTSGEASEAFIRKSLELKSHLLLGNFTDAIDGIDSLKALNPEKSQLFNQYLCNKVFGTENRDTDLIKYLLNKDFSNGNLQNYFVYEDDPFGHFQWSLENVGNNKEKSPDRLCFEELFKCRKKIIQGHKSTALPQVDENLHFELHSRYLELLILKCRSQKDLIKVLESVIFSAVLNSEETCKLSYAGRACRGLLYLKKIGFLKKMERWRLFCLEAFGMAQQNLELKAPIFAMLKIVYGENLPLDFFAAYHSENTLIESQMFLSMAFDEQEAVENYKKYLGLLK